jgi:hypothetical protein
VRVLASDEELSSAVGVQRVGGDDGPGEVQTSQQRLEPGDLVGGTVDLALGQHRARRMVHRSKQMNLAAVASGTPQGLAVDGDRGSSPPAGLVAVGEPRADHGGEGLGVEAGQGPADRWSRRNRPAAGERIAACAERGTHWLGRVSGPFGDRGNRPRTGQDRGGSDGEDGDQRMTATRAGPRVVDRGEISEQVRGLGWSERASVPELGQTRQDRG